jgi:periplasmic protein TonB
MQGLSKLAQPRGMAIIASAVLHAAALVCLAQVMVPARGSLAAPETASAIHVKLRAHARLDVASDVAKAASVPAMTSAAQETVPPKKSANAPAQARPAHSDRTAHVSATTTPAKADAQSAAMNMAMNATPNPMPHTTASNAPAASAASVANAASEEAPLHKAQPDYAYNPPPDYPPLLRDQGVEGVVWFKIRVESDGRPAEILMAKGSGYRLLDEAALRAVRRWRFLPARHGEQSLASWVEFPIRFSLKT